MRNVFLYLFISFSLFISCRDKNIKTSDEPKYTAEDSLSIIQSINIVDYKERFDLMNLDTNDSLYFQIDTLELRYVGYACDCPQWADAKQYEEIQKYNNSLPKDSEEYIQYDPNKMGYYIEPVNRELILEDKLIVPGNTFRFIGRMYKHKGIPKFNNFYDSFVPEGQILKYYSFEILKPYQIWGPQIFDSYDTETGDTITSTMLLMVK